MMRKFWILLFVFFCSGCLVRTYTVEKPRVDTEVSGNQGYLHGTVKPEAKKKKLSDTRKVSVLEVEVSGYHPKTKKEVGKKRKKAEPVILAEVPEFETEADSLDEEIVKEVEESQIETISLSKEKRIESYTVQKNDTLQKISKNYYGTTKKWLLIFEENKSKLSSPDKIYPGMVIKIPIL